MSLHTEELRRVAIFLELPIVKAIMIWPDLAARFELDAAHHLAEHGIKPLFGYFWNFCWNASFPGQARIHTGPHADCKNQIGCGGGVTTVGLHWVPFRSVLYFFIVIHRFDFVYTFSMLTSQYGKILGLLWRETKLVAELGA
ncbi:hypothetical protein C8R43DRAFT_943344 [Mycena crocata]|nr:hypothetical protein C8R43DRAFT_961352 [Mycena crocata]KAJ7175071.1 hypothetical protein C8R43DRAFT_943344 [Mycena crocata]